MTKSDYDAELKRLQLALVETQVAAAESGERVLIVLEGRDGAGKDGTIKRIVEHLAARATRIVALPKPTDRERSQWYLQRYVAHLPAAGEIVIFNRSWYNRAGVETVMGFSTPAEQTQFLRDAPDFERMLVESGIKLVKLWLDISRDEQRRRLDDRRTDPLKQLKVSDMDAAAQTRWSDYSNARNTMLLRTHTPLAPWFCVRGDEKENARIAVLRHLVGSIAPADIAGSHRKPDPATLFPFEPAAIADGRLAA
ncbi:polyphosphate kinase [Sphingomonas sp. Leaf22]|uniref:polyphosphate kinase 2 n=1 Tax=Sphingomonas sp. Leaf22 TaxID=1735687 RepID=UPI0007002D46|nr:polyphosphate kinase 2 [Sphingomonas sp. Leaf22]KQM79621.1 polyphosphate kinase [Sphingomonas sp. Leaf22]